MSRSRSTSFEDFKRSGGYNSTFDCRVAGTGPVRRNLGRELTSVHPYYARPTMGTPKGQQEVFMSEDSDRVSGTKLYISNLDYDVVSDQDIKAMEIPMVQQDITFVSEDSDTASGTKLYISNLDYGVSNQDIKVLFSDVGEMKSYGIHYDKSGRSKGTAEVVFWLQTDAWAAIRRYNNLDLDGKPMKIELVGLNVHTLPPPPLENPKPSSVFQSGRLGGRSRFVDVGCTRFSTVDSRSGVIGFSAYPISQVGAGGIGWSAFAPKGRGGGGRGGEGGGGGGRGGKNNPAKLSAEGLDADLDKFLGEAKKKTTAKQTAC